MPGKGMHQLYGVHTYLAHAAGVEGKTRVPRESSCQTNVRDTNTYIANTVMP
jgi:hypothetical protein